MGAVSGAPRGLVPARMPSMAGALRYAESVLLGGGRMLKDFESGVTGGRAGERRTIDVRYPDDYHNADLAGRVAKFEIDVKLVEEKHLPDLDDEFCREYGVLDGGIDRLRSEVADNMRRELNDNIRARVKQQLLDRLLESNPVDVPRGLVDAQVREFQLEAGRRIGAKEVSQLPAAEQFVETVALGPGMWAKLPTEMRQTFVFNAPTWLDEMNEQDAFELDLGRLAAFDRPALISRGDQSPPFFGSILDQIGNVLPHARRHTFNGAGHAPHLTHADDFVRVVGGFVGSAARP